MYDSDGVWASLFRSVVSWPRPTSFVEQLELSEEK
jgi:hypothetical protein